MGEDPNAEPPHFEFLDTPLVEFGSEYFILDMSFLSATCTQAVEPCKCFPHLIVISALN